MKYVSIDIETTGVNPERHQIVEFAAVLEDTTRDTPVDQLPAFHTYFDHYVLMCEPYNLAVFRTPEIIRQALLVKAGTIPGRIVTIDSFAKTFAAWLSDNGLCGGGAKVTFAGKNVGSFDLQFLKRTYDFERLVPYSNRFLDPAAFYAVPTDECLPNTATCLKRAGLDSVVSHTALDDAKAVIMLLRCGSILYERRAGLYPQLDVTVT